MHLSYSSFIADEEELDKAWDLVEEAFYLVGFYEDEEEESEEGETR